MRASYYLLSAAIVTAGSICSAASAPLPDAIPVEIFAMIPAVEGAELSPDGTRLAAKIAVNGRTTFMVMPVDGSGTPVSLNPGNLDINSWRWVGNNWLALSLGTKEVIKGEEMYITRLLGVSADLATVNKIDWARSGQFADDIIWAARDGSARILLSKQTGFETDDEWFPSVYEVDIATGKSKILIPSEKGVLEWHADSKGNVRLGSAYSFLTKRSSFVYRTDNRSPFKSIAIAEKDKDSPLQPSIFRPDGSAIAVNDGDGRYEVYEMSLPSFTLGRKLFTSTKYDADVLYLNATGDDLIGVGVTEKNYRVTWVDPAMKALQAKLDASAGAGHARIVDWNRDRTKLLVRIGSASQAGGLYYWDTARGSTRLVSWNNGKLKDRSLSPVGTVSYPARDGTMIEAVLTLPRGRAAKNLPAIVMPHGGPFARDDESYDWWAQYLAEQGYAVIQPNYRGSSGYGRDFTKLGEGQWGLKMQDDLNDALAWAAKQGVADPKRACMVGASYGGYAAMRAAQRDGNLYRCAVSYAGVSDLGAMTRYDSQFLFGDVRKKWLRKQAPDFRGVSPRFGASSFSAPILIAHGAEDKRVPVKQSRMMADELRKQGKPFEYLEQPEGDHFFSRSDDRLQFLKAMKAFLDKHNPA